MEAQQLRQEITMELLTDIATVLRSVGKDLMPLVRFTVFTTVTPPAVVLRVPGETNKPIQSLLKELAEACRDVTDKALPSLPLRYTVIGGSEASGIEVTARPDAEPVYGHVVKAKVDRLMVANALKSKPQLVDKAMRELSS